MNYSYANRAYRDNASRLPQTPEVKLRIANINEQIKRNGVQDLTDEDLAFYNQNATTADTGWQGVGGLLGATKLGQKINAVNSIVQAGRAGGLSGALSAM